MSSPHDVITWEEGWNKIHKEGILRLQSMIQGGYSEGKSFTNREYADLYSIIYKMCIQKNPHCYTPHLYEHYKQCINDYLTNTALPAIQSKQGPFMMLHELVRRWNDHNIMKKWMFDFFRYLDKFYVKRQSLKPLKEVCIERFRVLIFDNIKEKVTTALLSLIEKDRNREEVDRSLLQAAIRIYVDIGMDNTSLYSLEFEKPFIQATSDYYLREAAQWLGADSTPEYLRKAEVRFAQERRRLKDFLHPSSETKLMNTLYQAVLIQHQAEILGKENTGVKVMLETYAQQDLSRMFNLYVKVPAHLQPIADAVKHHIAEVGTALIDKVNDQKTHTIFVEELMQIHEKYLNMVVNCLGSNPLFQKAFKEAFENIVNKGTTQMSTAELLADYSNNILCKGGKRLEEKELQTTLDNIVGIFSYLTDKDIFSEFYRKLLSKRLLLQRSESIDSEKDMIGKLKLRCGAQYTSKLEGMINDMGQAVAHQKEFEDFLQASGTDLGVDFHVQTLTTGFWPTYSMDEVKIPPNLDRCLDSFSAYYNTKSSHNNRKLRWIHKLGNLTITGQFTKRKIDVVVSTLQAAILLLFNEYKELTIEAIIKHTNLEPDNVKRQLRSMVSGKFKILKKTPETGYNIKHTLSVNKNFTHAQRKIRIPNAAARTSNKERQAAVKTVQEDRRHAIEASIVRIMKARKTLEHRQLIVEVSQHLFQYFKPDPRQIKKRIEDLISREYLERDEANSSLFHYLA